MKKSRLKLCLLLAFSLLSPATSLARRDTLDLAGRWHYDLLDLPDSVVGNGVSARGVLSLPGTLDTNGVGIPVAPSDITTQLSRRYTYTGRVKYSRDVTIPESMMGKSLMLEMERTRPSCLIIDGKDIGLNSSVSAPQRYMLPYLTPGLHRIELIVDNGESIPSAVRNNSHACAEATQTNWNGIIGRFDIEAADPIHFFRLKVLSGSDSDRFRIIGSISNQEKVKSLRVRASSGNAYAEQTIDGNSTDRFELILDMGSHAGKWSEWNPVIHEITLTVEDVTGTVRDSMKVRSGLRKFSTSGTHFTINGDTTFLRGRHDACVWPLTAHVPMDIGSWRNYFRILKEYGINHVRFHSWCPPEACFLAADEAGVYLQPELTIWGGLDKEQTGLLEFLDTDMENILESYSSHPSFTMFSVGNELWGDIEIMRSFIDKARKTVPGLLATFGSNIYLGWNGYIGGEDYLVTCRVGGGDGFSSHARASFSFADADNGGIMNSTYPDAKKTFACALSKSPVPVIGHETGQYQIYPDYEGIEKYRGVLRADNLSAFRKKAEAAGTLRKARAYFEASGQWAARLYKEDMEMNLRTPGMGGFQLLDIQDYPGQGTAFVGMLDPFMDSKGFVTPEQWRRSCDDVTILANLPGYCFLAGDCVDIPLSLVNYGERDLDGTEVEWSLPFAKGSSVVGGGRGVLNAGSISLTIPYLAAPRMMELRLSADNGVVTNSYNIWIYPKIKNDVDDVVITRDIARALELLSKGERVILCPDTASVSKTTVGPLFQTDYWNYRMFRTICDKIGKKPSPGTLGLLIDDRHPVFRYFPTGNHTDWQWYTVASNSYPLIIDRLPASVDPVIEPIDNVERNCRLALMLECVVGKGKLMILMADPDKICLHPEGEWFMHSVKEYMASKRCRPTLNLTPAQVRDLLTKPSLSRVMDELNNVSY